MKRFCNFLFVFAILGYGGIGFAQSTEDLERSMRTFQQQMQNQTEEMQKRAEAMQQRILEMQRQTPGMNGMPSGVRAVGISQTSKESTHETSVSGYPDGYESLQHEREIRQTEGWIKRWWTWIIALPVVVFFFIFFFGLVLEVFWVWMFIDCLLNEPMDNGQKILWAVVLWFTNLFGAIVYFFVRYLERRRTSNPPSPTPPTNQPFSYLSASTHG